MWDAMSVALAVLALFVVFLIALVRRSVPTAADIARLAGPNFSPTGTTQNDDAVAVCRRYLTRHRRHRLAGGLIGVLFAAIIGVRWFGSVSIGLGQGSPLADLLFCGIAGVIVGTLSAESFRLTTTPDAKRAASLAPRPIPAGSERVAVSRTIAVAAVAVGAVAAFANHGWLALVTSLVLVVPLAVAELVMVVIAGRSRPAMTDRARNLDARLRTFAGSSLSYLHLATTSLMLGWTVAKIESLSGLLAIIRFCVATGCLIVAVAMLRRAAPRPSGGVLFGDGAPAE